MKHSALKRRSDIVFLFFFLFISLGVTAQNPINDSIGSHKIPLEKSKSGHLFATVKLGNKLTAHAMLESGIPYLMLDSAYVFAHQKELNLNLEAADITMNLSHHRIKCHYITNDTIYINHLRFLGKTLVANLQNKKKDLLLPLQKFTNMQDNHTRIYELDMQQGYLIALSHKSLNLKRREYQILPMTNDGYKKMYAIKQKYTLSLSSGKEYSIKGDFLLDLGNAAFLFFLTQHPDFQKFIKETPVKVVQPRNRAGKPLPLKAFYAPKSKIGKTLFKGHTVGITSFLPRFSTVGILGLKYFQQFNVIFDFDNKRLYLKRK